MLEHTRQHASQPSVKTKEDHFHFHFVKEEAMFQFVAVRPTCMKYQVSWGEPEDPNTLLSGQEQNLPMIRKALTPNIGERQRGRLDNSVNANVQDSDKRYFDQL